MTPPHLVVNGDCPDARSGFEERHNLGIKDMLKRIGATPAP
jgi:hypothetical protein